MIVGLLTLKVSFWSNCEGNTQGSVPHDWRSQWVVAGLQRALYAILHYLKMNVHHTFFHKFEFSGWVTMFKRLKTKWGFPVTRANTSSKDDSVWTQSEGPVPVSRWVIFLARDQPFGYTELTWDETRALPQTILWKNKLSVLCVGNKITSCVRQHPGILTLSCLFLVLWQSTLANGN